MNSLGNTLREKRLEKKLDLKDIAEELKIRIRYLEAIENGEYEEGLKPVYIQGYLRLYSNFLGIDISEFEEQNIPTDRKLAEIKNPATKEINRASAMVFAVSVVAILSIGTFWYKHSSKQDIEASISDNAYAPTQQSAEAQQDSAAQEGTQLPATDSMAAAENPPIEGATTEEVAKEQKASAQTGNAIFDSPSDNLKDTKKLVLVAKNKNHIKVFNEKGQMLYDGDLSADEIYFVPNEKNLLISAESKDDLEIYYDGKYVTDDLSKLPVKLEIVSNHNE